MSKTFTEVKMYKCDNCKGIFKTTRHYCRKDPEHQNCYTCEHWGHQFCFDKSYDGSEDSTCSAEEACKIDGQYAESAFNIMRENAWILDCPDYKNKEVKSNG